MRRSHRPVRLESLESRRLLSAAAELVPLLSTAGTRLVAPDMVPTYRIEMAADGADQTAGPSGFSPSQIRTAYGMNQVSFGSVTGNGAGQTIAIIDAYNDPTIQADLNAFDAAFGLANTTLTVVNQGGGSTLPSVDPAGPGSSDWEVEEALDVEWAHSLAPGANIVLVEANDSSPSNLFAAANFARQQTGVSVVSMSFGGNEASSETQYDSIFTTPAGHSGVTFIASAGDSGSPAGYPAYSPNVLAIGGTGLSVDSLGNYVSETGWSGSGGGISQVEAQPSYQSGVVTQSTTKRTAPDVAFDANPSSGVSVYDSYNNGTSHPWEIIGGTSLGAPSWAGIIAVANQGRAIAGEGALTSNTGTLSLIYSAPTSDFHDITSGNNGFAAGVGYDLVTGRGSPVANLLLPYLVNGTVVTPPPSQGPTITSITASPTSVPEGDQFTLTANGVSDTGGTGLVLTFYEESNGAAGLQTGSGGDYSFTPITDGSTSITLNTTGATPGTYTFYAQLTDSSGAASPAGTSAPTTSITVTAPGGSSGSPVIGSIIASPNPVVSGNSLTLTATNITDPDVDVTEVIFYEETNGIPGLQTGRRGGDFSFRPVGAASGFSILLDTTGVTGSLTFYALAVDALGNESATGTSAPSVAVDITSDTPPDAPSGLTASAISPTQIDLSFSEVSSGQTGFTIDRSTDPTFQTFTQLFTINVADATTYDDTGLTPNSTYYYRVEAFNSAGDSAFSNTAHATTTAAKLAFGGQPTTASAGQSLGAVVVDVEDQSGNVLAADDSSVTLSVATGPSSALNGTLTVQAVNGVATFGELTLDIAGTYTLAATDSTSGATAVASDSFVVNAAAAARLAWAVQPGNVITGDVISPAAAVHVEDQFGNIVASNNSTVSLGIATGPASATLGGATAVAAIQGVATFSNLSLEPAGAYSLIATDGSLTSAISTSFNVTAPASFATLSNGALLVTCTPGNDTIALTTSGSSLIAALNGVNSSPIPLSSIISIDVQSQGGNDLITLGAGVPAASVEGGPGNDTILGGAGNDSIRGGAGDDLIAVGDGNNFIKAGKGADTVQAGAGDNTITCGNGNDNITSGAGDNTITLGDGNDSVYCNGGNDTVVAGDGRNFVQGGHGTDQITVGNGHNVIHAGKGNDRIQAGTGHNTFILRGGSDTVVAGAGNDTILGGSGKNDITTAGADLLFIQGGDTVSGTGNDTIWGGSGASDITGVPADQIQPGRPADWATEQLLYESRV